MSTFNTESMDIKIPKVETQIADNTPNKNGEASFKTGTVQQASAALIIPPAVAQKLSHLSKIYGLPLDMSQIDLKQATPDNIKSMRQIIDLLVNNSKLLPEMLQLCKRLLKSEIKLAEFHRDLTKAAIKHQEKIDKVTADIFLSMAGYQAKSSKMEHRVNTRNQLIDKRNKAYADHYQNSIYGDTAQLIDVEYQVAASNHKVLTDAKTKKLEFSQDRKKKAQEYISQAFAN